MSTKSKVFIGTALVIIAGLSVFVLAAPRGTKAQAAPLGPIFEPIAKGTANVLEKISHSKGLTTLDLEKATIKVGDSVPWHCHPGPVLFIMVQGELTTFAPDGTSRVLKVGDADIEQVGTARESENLGTEDVVVYILFSPPEGLPGTIWLTGPDDKCVF